MKTSAQPWFPPVREARSDGLLSVGGQLSPSWLLTAYRRGIFPWPVIDGGVEILAWFSPDPRAILEFGDLHVSRRLRRRIHSGQFEVTFDRAFGQVVAECAAPRRKSSGTWITPRLAAAYVRLHGLGFAHSVETWEQGQLVGGVYGVALGGFFAGESMFYRKRDASKVALVGLVQRLQQRGFRLFDVQQASPLLRTLGAREIPRPQFLQRLEAALELPVDFAEPAGPAPSTAGDR